MSLSASAAKKNKRDKFGLIKSYSGRVFFSLLIAFTAALGTTLIVRAVANITATMTDTIIGDDGDGKADPGETIEYTTVITNSGTDATGVTFNDVIDANTTLVGGSVNVSPLAINDSFDTIGNTLLDVSNGTPASPVVHVAGSLFDNDVEFLGATFDSANTHITSHVGPSNGTLTLDNNTGTFTYLPNANFTGSDSFTYTLTDAGGLTDTATVNINVVNRVWYVKNDVAGTGTGRSNDPFKALASAQTASSAGDTIYVFLGNGTTSSQNAGFTFKNGQRLLGEAVDLTISIPSGSFNGVSAPTTVTLKTGVPANQPKIGNAAGNGVTVSTVDIGGNFSGVEVRGLDISSAGAGTNAIDITTDSTFSGSFELADNVISAAVAEGIDVNSGGSGTLTVSIHDNTVTATGNGIDILRGVAAGSVNIVAFDDNIVTGATGGMGMNVVGTGGTILFDANPSTAAYEAISGGTTVIGSSGVGNGTGGAGMVLTNIKGDLSFTDLDIYTDSGAALSVSGASPNFVASGTGTRVTANINTPTFVAANGPALSTNQTNINIIPTTFSSANSATNGVSLVETSGTLTAPSSSSISNASGIAFAVDGNLLAAATVSVTYAGTITDDLGGLVNIQNVTGGNPTYAFTGAITDGNDGDGSGISLNNNDSATIRFSGGLLLSTASNPAFTATGGAVAVEVCDDNPCNSGTGGLVNTLTTTTATALNVSNTTIGANNLEFKSISSSGGSSNGIILDTTGSSGGLKVVGDGTNTSVGGNSSGGTIANKSGSDGSATQGTGIYLNNTSNVVLRRMTISGTNQNFGIRGINSSNITLEYSTVTGTNGTDLATDEGSVNFDNLTGSAAITSCVIEGGLEDNLNIVNTSGTLNQLTITGTTFGFNNTTSGNNNILIESQNSGTTLNFTLQSSIIKGARADWINASNNSSSIMNAVISGNTFDNLGANAHPGAAAGGNRVVFGSVGQSTIDIKNNTLQGSKGEAIRVRSTASGALTGTVDARVRNNIVGAAGTSNSGSSEGSGIFAFVDGGGDMNIAITNNQVFQYNNHGILLQDGDEINDGSVFNATVTGNTVNSPGNLNTNFNGIHLNNGTVGATDNFTSCIDIGGAGALANNIVNSGNGSTSPNNQEFRLRQRQSTTVKLPGYAGANNNDAAVVTYIQGRNTVTSGNGAASNTVPTGGGYIGGAACTQPSFALMPDNYQALAQVQPETNPVIGTQAEILKSVNASVVAFASVNLSGQVSEANSYASLSGVSTITDGSGKPLFSIAQPAQAQSGEEIGPITIGTLPAGKSVTIKFQVEVNDPITVGTIKILNQATIESNELADVLTTDPSPNADPACTGSGTKTCTPVDRPNTTISSINRAASSPTNASTVSWTVTFADPVSNLTNSNFALVATGGVAGASITSVSAVGSAPDDQWTVTANTGSGDGTLGLNMANDTGASHDITVLPFTGQVYTLDLTPPTVTINQKSTAPAQADPAGSSPINFTVIFSEAVTDFDDAADVTLTGSAGADTVLITGGPTTYNVAVSGMTSDGTVVASIPAGVATDGVNTNDASTSTDNSVLYDTNPPTVTIDQAIGQDDPTNGSTIHFTVEFNEDVTGFINGDVTLTSPFSLSQNITGGPRIYDVAVTGMSGSGTITATVNSSVALDLASQPNDASTSTDNEVTFDDIAPDTTITGNPTNPTASTSGTFTFSGSDPETGIDGFECNLDSGGFNTCSSGVSFTSLSDGSHTLQVRAIDNAGNVDATPASYTWVVDATSPDTTITSNPSNPTNSTSATFNFSGNDASGTGVASFECKLDGSSFAACTDPASYTGLSEGSHTFEVRAIDNVGNVDATPASYTWAIDTTAPGVTITGNPTNPTNSTSATFTFTGDDGTGSGVSGFECKLDSGSFGTCVSGVNYTSLSAGSHTFEVRAIDTANNVGILSDTYTWVIDLTAPTVTINQASGQSDPTNNNSINFTAVFSEPVTGFIGSDVSLSGTASPSSAVVTESAPNDGTTYNVAVSGMTSGGTVIATIPVNVVQDLATNNNAASTSTDNTVTFTVDTTTTITSDTPEPSIVGQAVTVNFTVTAALGTPTGSVTITDSASAATCTGTVAAGTCNITLTSSGAHTLTATYGTSGTFNGSSDTESHSVSVTLTVNTFADDLTTNGNCSLREAVRAANTNVAVDTCPAGSASIVDVIKLATGTYTISRSGADDTAMNGDLDITGNTRIVGTGAANTFISGASLDRVFHILSGTVQIDDLTVKSGSNATGGGIYNAGTLTLNSVTVTANAATSAATGTSHGAGIYNTGTLTLNNSTVSNNTATSGVSGKSRGGGIHNNGGTLTLNSSTVTGNKALSGGLGISQGGGIYTSGGSTTLNSTTPSGNTVVTGAGGSAAGPNTYP